MSAPRQDSLRPGEIAGEGEFQIVLVALDDGHVKPRRARHLDIVGAPPGWARCAARMASKRKACGVCARQSPARSCVPVTSPSSPRHSASVTGRAGAAPAWLVQRRHHPPDQRARHQRPRAVMDQHPRHAGARQRLQRIPHRGIARGAARTRRNARYASACGPRAVVGVDDQQDPVDRIPAKARQRVRHDRSPGQHLPLLRHARRPRACRARRQR